MMRLASISNSQLVISVQSSHLSWFQSAALALTFWKMLVILMQKPPCLVLVASFYLMLFYPLGVA